VKKELDVLKNSSKQNGALPHMGNAPGFDGATKWLNLPAGRQVLKKEDLKGKVVLVDFWTYTCINCIRTLPHVTRWYDKYKDQGFVVIGVHTPEFEFEKDSNNVLAAIKQFNIHYPVPQDNNYAIWNNFNNQYWPAEYLIDANGVLRRTHFGEGEYDEMEQAIQGLLKEAGKKVDTSLDTMPDTTPHMQLSPETYLGSNRAQYYFPSGGLHNGTKEFTVEEPSDDSFSLGGNWTITGENAVAGNKAVLVYNFYADKVFLVMRPPTGKNGKVKVYLDGKVVGVNQAGKDVQDGTVTVDTDRLYELIDLKNNPGKHTLRLEFQTPGTQGFAFTFG
jgi:thiol-disulfide isomerase/thioredoxin